MISIGFLQIQYQVLGVAQHTHQLELIFRFDGGCDLAQRFAWLSNNDYLDRL